MPFAEPFSFISLLDFLEERRIRRIFILADDKVVDYYPHFWNPLLSRIAFTIFPVVSSEDNKNLKLAEQIWEKMLEDNIRSEDLLVNWGGGFISDVGGFAASVYKRGIPFINVPTTLLGMIDAAIGGKNGLNLFHLKNMIGTFRMPEKTMLDFKFLETLSWQDILNGFGEMTKYALIQDKSLWEELKSGFSAGLSSIHTSWIEKSVRIKESIVEEDPYDLDKRRTLNFGHTVGHALETYTLQAGKAITHGHAVALGLCCECYISYLHHFMNRNTAEEVKEFIVPLFPLPQIPRKDFVKICELMFYDKKNNAEGINFTLLKEIGFAVPNQQSDTEEILESLKFLFC